MKTVKTTIHLTTGQTLESVEVLTEETAQSVGTTLEEITAVYMVQKMDDLMTEASNMNLKLTRLTSPPHFVRWDALAAITYEVIDED